MSGCDILPHMTPERIPRHDDERLYQPKIHSKHTRALRRLSLETGAPMTVLADQALEEFVARYPGCDSRALPQTRPGSSSEVLQQGCE